MLTMKHLTVGLVLISCMQMSAMGRLKSVQRVTTGLGKYGIIHSPVSRGFNSSLRTRVRKMKDDLRVPAILLGAASPAFVCCAMVIREEMRSTNPTQPVRTGKHS